jgi:hypothetical protein
MTETPTDTTDQTPDPDAQAAHCRHCGVPSDAPAGSDFQCASCERYQDTVACPTCHQPARISLLPEGTAPEPHAPTRRRKAKE